MAPAESSDYIKELDAESRLDRMADFFISYTSVDKAWAEWIGYVLEERGYKVIIQAWDFRPGANFVLEMQRAAKEAHRTILVLSPDYLQSQFASSEWAAAFAEDPEGLNHRLLPIMVRECKPGGLLRPIVRISLVDQSEGDAEQVLLSGVDAQRAKPTSRPSYPGATVARPHKSFPGNAEVPETRRTPYLPHIARTPTDADKRRFIRQAFGMIKAHFDEGLKQLTQNGGALESDFEDSSATEFTAELFLSGKSVSRCRVWVGGMTSNDSVSYAEGRWHHGDNSCNDMLSIATDHEGLYLTSLMGMGFGRYDEQVDTKRMTPDQASEYLWRRFIAPLER